MKQHIFKDKEFNKLKINYKEKELIKNNQPNLKKLFKVF